MSQYPTLPYRIHYHKRVSPNHVGPTCHRYDCAPAFRYERPSISWPLLTQLPTGYQLPLLGLGVYLNNDAKPASLAALKAGYRYGRPDVSAHGPADMVHPCALAATSTQPACTGTKPRWARPSGKAASRAARSTSVGPQYTLPPPRPPSSST